MVDAVLVNIIGVSIGVITVFGGSVGILVRQSRNNGRNYQQLKGMEDKIDAGNKVIAAVQAEIGQCSVRIAAVEGYLQGMEEFRKHNGG